MRGGTACMVALVLADREGVIGPKTYRRWFYSVTRGQKRRKRNNEFIIS